MPIWAVPWPEHVDNEKHYVSTQEVVAEANAMAHTCNPSTLERLRHEDYQFEPSLAIYWDPLFK